MTYREWIDSLKAQYIGKRVLFNDHVYNVVDVDYNGCLLIDCPARFTETTAISITSAQFV